MDGEGIEKPRAGLADTDFLKKGENCAGDRKARSDGPHHRGAGIGGRMREKPSPGSIRPIHENRALRGGEGEKNDRSENERWWTELDKFGPKGTRTLGGGVGGQFRGWS